MTTDPARAFARWRQLRSLALHRLVAERMRADPALFEAGRRRLQRWKVGVSENSLRYLTEWEALAEVGLDAVTQVLLEDSERAFDLRKCSPFGFEALTEEERRQFLKEWSASRPG